jgi:hypothetical protein
MQRGERRFAQIGVYLRDFIRNHEDETLSVTVQVNRENHTQQGQGQIDRFIVGNAQFAGRDCLLEKRGLLIVEKKKTNPP